MRCWRFFGGLPELQERWLNQMACKGYRLTAVGKLSYDFAPCPPGSYQYAVTFVGHLSRPENQDYRAFLEEVGYRVFSKNANLNFSLTKLRWRPYGRGWGQLALKPGAYDKELLIVEKAQDDRPFQLQTTNADRAAYYRPLRDAWLTAALLFGGGAAVQLLSGGGLPALAFGALALLCAVPAALYQRSLSFYTRLGGVAE